MAYISKLNVCLRKDGKIVELRIINVFDMLLNHRKRNGFFPILITQALTDV